MQIIQDAANTNLMFLIQIIVISATYKKNNKNKFQTHRLQCSLYRFWYASLVPGFIPSKTNMQYGLGYMEYGLGYMQDGLGYMQYWLGYILEWGKG